jgi:hypothetical protein
MMRERQTTLHVLCMLAVVSLAVDLAAQSPAPPHIQDLAGCFHVSYRFVEDGTHDYEIKDALEWITVKALSLFDRRTQNVRRDQRWRPIERVYFSLSFAKAGHVWSVESGAGRHA